MTFKDLLAEIGDSAKPLHLSSLYALSNLGKADLATLRAVWPGIAVERRRKIVQDLVEIGEESVEVDFSDALRTLLDDADAEVRAAAVDGLWECEDVTLIKIFIALLQNDPAELVRARAATALGRYMYLAELEELSTTKATQVKQALLAAHRHPGETLEVRRRALEALSALTDPEIHDLTAAAYQHPEEKMRVSAVFAMGHSGHTRWRSTVLKELDNPSPAIRFEAAKAAGELEAKKAVPRLIELLADSDREIQQAAAWSLGQIGGKQAKEALRRVAKGKDEVLREAAGAALEELAFWENPLGAFDDLVGEEETTDSDMEDEDLDEE
jgi:HEAT repeat protein